jgi:limonene-1,2-epoxide hydrolase
MSKLSPLEIVKGFQKSVATGSDDWNSIVSDQIVFKGPVDQVSGKDRFIQLNRGFFPLVQEYKPVNAFEGASSVCLEGIFKVKTPKGNVIELEMAEVYLIKEGKIENIRVYYDAEQFRKEFAK